jgi:glycosyltransferase involved in cell wall biosynthesis
MTLHNKMKYPTFSIVIPSFNQGDFIERTILSILNQNYPGKIEVIVSDGGSTDATVDVLKKYDDKITWWSAPDKGFVDAVNKGFTKVTGDICAIQSSDDFYLEGAFKIIADEFEKNPNASLICGEEILLEANGKAKMGISLLPEININTFFLDNWWIGITQHTTFFRKKIFGKVNGLTFPFNPASEQELYYRMIRISPGKFINNLIGVYQLHDNQMTRVSDSWEKALLHIIEHSYKETGYNYTPTIEQKQSYEDFIKLFFLDRKDPIKAKEFAATIKSNNLIPKKTIDLINKQNIDHLPENNNTFLNFFSNGIRLFKYSFLTKGIYKLIKPNALFLATNEEIINNQKLPNINWWKN